MVVVVLPQNFLLHNPLFINFSDNIFNPYFFHFIVDQMVYHKVKHGESPYFTKNIKIKTKRTS